MRSCTPAGVSELIVRTYFEMFPVIFPPKSQQCWTRGLRANLTAVLELVTTRGADHASGVA